MKVTMKAILINETEEQKQIINNMMLVFCTAIRFSFKRLLENNIKITELEKIVASKYNFNIRQAKDAVESARQTIQSQKELVKMNYEEYSNKVKAIEKLLNDKTKNGNPNLRVIILNDMSYLEISTLEKTTTNRSIKTQVPIYLPQKLSKKTGLVNGINYRDMFLNHLINGEAYQVEILKRNNKYYCHITFESPNQEVLYTGHKGMIGIDTNPDGFALTMIDNNGNYKWHTYLKQHELLYARTNRRENLCGELVKQVILIAKTYGCGIATEDLKFINDKDVHSKFARIKHQFIYSKLLTMLGNACIREGIEIIKVKPQFTSKIGLYKYCHQYGMVVHNGAGMVIARRSYKFKEKVPRILKDKLVINLDRFNNKNEWSKWNELNKIIKRKVGENPDLWLVNRKKILGIVK